MQRSESPLQPFPSLSLSHLPSAHTADTDLTALSMSHKDQEQKESMFQEQEHAGLAHLCCSSAGIQYNETFHCLAPAPSKIGGEPRSGFLTGLFLHFEISLLNLPSPFFLIKKKSGYQENHFYRGVFMEVLSLELQSIE